MAGWVDYLVLAAAYTRYATDSPLNAHGALPEAHVEGGGVMLA